MDMVKNMKNTWYARPRAADLTKLNTKQIEPGAAAASTGRSKPAHPCHLLTKSLYFISRKSHGDNASYHRPPHPGMK